ncbi:SRPBCC family protein [Altererythrobacter sp.]|uniref:SRPBCC family protein n=1 Tax=Altererythrobacter sp. TaxID=1872480 RepID=UPI003D0D39B0
MFHRLAALAFPIFLMAQPASAEVISASDDSFVTRDVAVVRADAKSVWMALISPARWWNSAHTWSGDSANLSLKPQAGGCFCERIPEDPDPKKITLEGSVEHMRVIQAFPEKVLRMRGGLGPLQSEPATGVLTIVLSEHEKGTQIVWEYAVGGAMRYPLPVISKAVDGVMSQQLDGLANMLGGRLDAPPPPSPEPAQSEDETEDEATQGQAPEISVEDAIDAMQDD